MNGGGAKRLLTAAWVAPMSSPPFRDGAVVIDKDRLVALGPIADLRRQYPDVPVTDLGHSIILAGLINAHTHLELSHMTPGPPPTTFTDWLIRLLQSHQTPADSTDSIKQAMMTGIAQSLRFGVTTVGNITTHPPSAHLIGEKMRGVSFGEVRAMAQRRNLLEERLTRAVEQPCADRVLIGVSPHAPYSIEPDGYRRCLCEAIRLKIPLTTHLAESPHEREFLATHTGPFRELWRTLNAWDSQVPRFEGGPIRFAQSLGLLDYEKTSLAHVNYCDDDELAILSRGRASVIYCPRTHRYFNHPPHRWRDMLAAGINVAIGTDSCASAPDLNLIDDLRLLHAIAPDFPVDALWQMATTNAARALNIAGIGALALGHFADLTIFDAAADDPLREILEDPSRLPRNLWIAGRPVQE